MWVCSKHDEHFIDSILSERKLSMNWIDVKSICRRYSPAWHAHMQTRGYVHRWIAGLSLLSQKLTYFHHVINNKKKKKFYIEKANLAVYIRIVFFQTYYIVHDPISIQSSSLKLTHMHNSMECELFVVPRLPHSPFSRTIYDIEIWETYVCVQQHPFHTLAACVSSATLPS